MNRDELVADFARRLAGAAAAGVFTNGRPVIVHAETVAGPRAGAVELVAGMDAGKLLRALAADDCALARQFVPWNFVGEPAAYMAGRHVRVEAGWPDGLAETEIRLAALGQHPRRDGRWIAGKNEIGQTVTLGLNDRTPHWLLAGATGSGKSVALRSAVLQLSRDPGNRLVLVDGKWGEGLGELARLPGVVGPVAADVESARAALGWVLADMRRRYEHRDDPTRLVVVVDEFQELTGKSGDAVVQESLRRIVAQGRAARVHALLATQHPTIDSFGDPAIKRNLVGRVAMRVMDAKASEVAVGGTAPRADHLLGAGDAYCVAPGGLHRAQLVLVDRRDLASAERTEPLLASWPEAASEDLGRPRPVGWSYTGAELAVSIAAAHFGKGRPTMAKWLDRLGLGRPGGERGTRLLRLGRETHDWLATAGLLA